MTDTISHRGPDGEGYWISENGLAGFGHRRLAIIDLSEKGGQPMHYPGGYTIVYNGEIYNYREIRQELANAGHQFVSESDTEVILAAYKNFGPECCEHLDGMFSFAIWDEQQQTLFAARDRFGEKPFCYSVHKGTFFFASEAKAIRAVCPGISIDPQHLIRFMALGHTRNAGNASETVYREINELPAAHYLYFSPGAETPVITQYWNLDISENANITEAEATDTFNRLFTQSIERRLRSDVRLGTSLSGGLDSSSIVATMSSFTKPETFSAVFPGYERDESENINMINTLFGCHGHMIQPTVNDLADQLDKILWHQEAPVSSASIFAQYKVFELASQAGTKVLLDGQGADETLGGYSNQLQWGLQEIYRKSGTELKTNLRGLGSEGVPYKWGLRNRVSSFLPALTAGYLKQREHRKVISDEFISKEYLDAYYNPADLAGKPVISKLNDILFHHTTQYGLNELLHYADRNSMAHGREVRLPFLNHELVQFVFSLPVQFKIREGFTKWILRKNMAGKLPDRITWQRKKIGFDPPQKAWMMDAKLQTLFFQARTSLVEKGILSKRVLSKKIQPRDTHAADNYDWRFLVTDLLLKQ